MSLINSVTFYEKILPMAGFAILFHAPIGLNAVFFFVKNETTLHLNCNSAGLELFARFANCEFVWYMQKLEQ